jgi:hypothetical protein
MLTRAPQLDSNGHTHDLIVFTAHLREQGLGQTYAPENWFRTLSCWGTAQAQDQISGAYASRSFLLSPREFFSSE